MTFWLITLAITLVDLLHRFLPAFKKQTAIERYTTFHAQQALLLPTFKRSGARGERGRD